MIKRDRLGKGSAVNKGQENLIEIYEILDIRLTIS